MVRPFRRDIQTSGQFSSAGGEPRFTNQMHLRPLYLGWDFSDTWWNQDSAATYPLLRMERRIYRLEQLQAMKNDRFAHYTLMNDIDASATSGWNEFPTLGFYQGFER